MTLDVFARGTKSCFLKHKNMKGRMAFDKRVCCLDFFVDCTFTDNRLALPYIDVIAGIFLFYFFKYRLFLLTHIVGYNRVCYGFASAQVESPCR